MFSDAYEQSIYTLPFSVEALKDSHHRVEVDGSAAENIEASD